MALKPGVNAGFTAGVMYWLLFMIAFTILGYKPLFSICFGAIGAIAGGVIAAWYNPKEGGAPPKLQEKPAQPKSVPEAGKKQGRSLQPGVGFMKQRRHRTKADRRFGWLFRRQQ